jgi:two-component system cell cycle sensor histidine kinase/response regulator CckA
MIRSRSLLLAAVASLLVGAAAWFSREDGGPRLARAGYVHDPPYMFQGADGTPQGLDVDVLQQAARRAGITLDWVYVTDASNADTALKGGQVDIWPALTVLPTRDFFFTDPWLQTEVWVVVRDGASLPPSTFDGVIGVAPLPVADFLVRTHYPRARQASYRDGPALAEALCIGAVKVGLLAAADLAQAVAAPDGRCRAAHLVPFVLPESTLRIAVAARPGHERTATRLREQIDAMAADGTIRAIVLPYSFHAATEVLAVYELMQERARVRHFRWGTAILGVALIGALGLAIALWRAEQRTRQSMQEKSALEEKLRATQRLELVGQFAGGIAHDFNNLVTVIVGYSALAVEHAGPDGLVAEAVAEIRRAADRASDLVRQLLAFGRKEAVEPQVLDLHDQVRALQPMVRRLLRENIDLNMTLDADPAPILIDAGQLSRVLLNLTVNASDAMPGGGAIRITTSRIPPGDGAPARVRLSFEDTGAGMSPEVQAHAFEPFFTTKEPGRGTGLGLSVVHGIVHQAGGGIDLVSTPGAGARFDLWFPLAAGGAVAAPATPPSPRDRPDRAILVVEDRADVRAIVSRTLRSAGFRVIEAADGLQALDRLRETRGDVALVVSDIVMPHLSGIALAMEVERTLGSIPFLFMSGHVGEAMPQGDGTVRRLLAKPFTPAQLLEAVAEMLTLHP